MYSLDEHSRLQHGVMGPPHVTPPAFCNAGGGLWSSADDYLRFVRMLLGDGTIDGVRVLSGRVGPADADRPAHRGAEAAQFPGRAVLGGPRLRAEPVGGHRPGKEHTAFRPGRVGTFSWPGAYGTWWQADPTAELILIYLIQNLPDLTVDAATAVAGNTSLAKLRTAQPRFVRTTYRALGL